MTPRIPSIRPQPLREPVPEEKDQRCGAGPQGSHRASQPEEGCPLQGALVLGHGSGSHGDSRKKKSPLLWSEGGKRAIIEGVSIHLLRRPTLRRSYLIRAQLSWSKENAQL